MTKQNKLVTLYKRAHIYTRQESLIMQFVIRRTFIHLMFWMNEDHERWAIRSADHSHTIMPNWIMMFRIFTMLVLLHVSPTCMFIVIDGVIMSMAWLCYIVASVGDCIVCCMTDVSHKSSLIALLPHCDCSHTTSLVGRSTTSFHPTVLPHHPTLYSLSVHIHWLCHLSLSRFYLKSIYPITSIIASCNNTCLLFNQLTLTRCDTVTSETLVIWVHCDAVTSWSSITM